MADPKHMKMLKRGREAWKQWRASRLDIRPEDGVDAFLRLGATSGKGGTAARLRPSLGEEGYGVETKPNCVPYLSAMKDALVTQATCVPKLSEGA